MDANVRCACSLFQPGNGQVAVLAGYHGDAPLLNLRITVGEYRLVAGNAVFKIEES